MKDVRHITTDDVRVGYSDGTYDDELAGTEFDLWIVTERNRVAELAIKKERTRIIALLDTLHRREAKSGVHESKFCMACRGIALIEGEEK